MCYYLEIIFPRFGLASPVSENGKKGLERPCCLFITLTAHEGMEVWTEHVQLSEAESEVSLLGQACGISPEQIRFEAGCSDTKHPQEDS